MNNQQEKTMLSESARRALKRMAHHLKPVVRMGKLGVTDALIAEIQNALLAHELIKVQIAAKEKENLISDLEDIANRTGSLHVGTIGNVVILFKQRPSHSQFDL